MIFYPLFIFIGIFPSIIWLLFFLRKDVHPESNFMVIKIFLFGALATLPAFLLELGAFDYFSYLFGESSLSYFLFLFLGVALIEEVVKYLVVRDKVLNSSELDEPADVILYMIISALGFAAVENTFQLIQHQFKTALIITFLRFWGAIFLHALCSGLLGYYLALSLFDTKNRIKLKFRGIFLAALLHGLFNFSIIKTGKALEGSGTVSSINYPHFFIYLILIVSILAGLAIFVSFGFKRLQRVKSICKIII